jgi:hypothetical protein
MYGCFERDAPTMPRFIVIGIPPMCPPRGMLCLSSVGPIFRYGEHTFDKVLTPSRAHDLGTTVQPESSVHLIPGGGQLQAYHGNKEKREEHQAR